MNPETSPITTQHLPQEETLIHKTLEKQSIIGTCLKTVVEAHKEENPIFSLNHHCQSKERNLQVMEDLYKLENHEYVGPIESWFQTIVSTPHSLIIQKVLVPYQVSKLVSHTPICVKICILNFSVSIFSILLCTWLHWKYAFT